LSRTAWVAVLAGAFAASACAAPTQLEPPALEGTRWVMAGAKSSDESTPRLEFTREGRVSGNTGCNRLSGSFRLEEDRLDVVAATTKRACMGAGGDAEQKLLAVLADRPRVKMDGQRLVLTGSSGATFVLERAP
jgi:heat shock protein HslJ